MDFNATTSPWATHIVIAQDTGSSGVLGAPSGSTPPAGSQPLGTPGTGAPSGSASGMGSLFPILIFMMAGILIMTSLSGRKERKKHAALMAGIGKKDKVRAAGGIIGTIIEIKNDEVLIETDKASNTRIRVARGSITTIISSKSKPEKTNDESQSSESAETPELVESK